MQMERHPGGGHGSPAPIACASSKRRPGHANIELAQSKGAGMAGQTVHPLRRREGIFLLPAQPPDLHSRTVEI